MTVIGLLAISGLAYAVPTESEDTVFNYAYDTDFHLFVWNVSDVEADDACSLENGAVSVTYGAVTDSVVAVEHDDACVVSASEVAGPNGQINHGMFMKLFKSLYEGQGRGCLNRYLAQSDLGKDDQKINVSDVDTEFVSAVEGDLAELDFVTIAADCQRGKKNDGDGAESSAKRHGRPDSPGKSGSAPGRNK